MKKDEKVFRVRETDDNCNDAWTVADGIDFLSTKQYIRRDGAVDEFCEAFPSEAKAQAALDLYLEKQKLVDPNPLKGQAAMREYPGGATRDTAQGKLDYVKALSPTVLRRYVQYLDKHRLQSDGSYRDFDNWKKGIPQGTYHSSGGRHFFDVWLLTEGETAEDNHGPVDLEDALCAQLFNIMGRLHEIIKERLNCDAAIDHETRETNA